MIQNERKRMWLYALTGMMLTLTTTGFARMSYGVLMPYMQEELQLTHAQAGLLGTFISLGYLFMVIAAGIFASRLGQKRVIVIGALLVTLSLFGFSSVPAFGWAITVSILAGIGSAMAFVPLVSYMVAAFPQKRGFVLGLLLSGSGIAMLISGSILPIQGALFNNFSWRVSWLIFAIVSILVTFFAAFILKEPKLAGEEKSALRQQIPKASVKKVTYQNKEVMKIALLYFSVGVAYLIPILFQTGYMLHVGIPSNLAGITFAVAGLFGIIGGPFLGGCSDWLGRRTTLIIALSLAILGTFLPVIWSSTFIFLLSATLLGLLTGSLIVLIQAAVSEQVKTDELPIAVGFITFFFASGQLIGPGLGGWLIERGEHFSSAYLLSSFLYFIGLGICISIKFSEDDSKKFKKNVAGA